MKIAARYYHHIAILSAAGRFDNGSSQQFAEAVIAQTTNGYVCLVVDLKQVDFLTSGGIKSLVKAIQQAREKGGDLRVANASHQVLFALKLSGLDRLIKMYPNVVCATASYFSESELPNNTVKSHV